MATVTPFTLAVNDLTKLGQDRAVEFFRRLLWAEATRVGMGRNLINVPQCINVGDGGIDAVINDANPSIDEIIPRGTSGFQIKSSDLLPRQCKKELHQGQDLKKPIQPEVKRLLDAGGTYVLVLFADLTDQKKKAREEALKDELRKLKYPRAKVRLLTASQMLGFAEQFPALVVWFKNDLSQCLPYSSWADRHDVKVPKTFIGDQQRSSWAQETRRILRERSNACPIARVTGLSGIGKTRLVFETLGDDDLRNLVLYVHAHQFLSSDLYNRLQIDEKLNAVLVIDECDLQKHEEFVRAFASRGARLAVITLSDEIGSVSSSSSLFRVSPLGRSAMETILRTEVSNLPANVITRLSQFADGYPRIAILLAESYQVRSGSSEEFFAISDQALIERLIGGRKDTTSDHFKKTRRVLAGLSVFRKIGFQGLPSKEAEWLARKLEISWTEFCEIVREQKQRGIIQGEYYIYVTPFMFRIYLLREWWETQGTTKEGFFKFISDIPEELRRDLLIRLSDHLPYITTTNSGVRFAKEILGREGIFSDGMALKNELGANFFLKLTEADPDSALDCLKRTVGLWSKEDLRQFTTGRREVVSALERTAMWRDLFADSARLLLALGEAENETWSNNASGVFVQLFSSAPGEVAPTEASPEERFSILREALESSSKEKRLLGLQACDQALESQHFTRMIGAEHQGVRREPQLWRPKTYGELFDAYRRVWIELADRIDSLPEDEQQKAIEILVSNSRGLVRYENLRDMILTTLSDLTEKPFVDNKEILAKIIEVLHYDGKTLSVETRQRLEKLKERLTGTDFPSLLRRYVGMDLLEDQFDETGNQIDQRKPRIEALAQQAVENTNLLWQELAWLVTTKAQNGFTFGFELGTRDKQFGLLPRLIEAQRNAGKDTSVFFVGGYFRAIYQNDRQKWEKILDSLVEDETIRVLVPELTWRSGPLTDTAALRVLRLAQKGYIQIGQLRLFAYGSVINPLSDEVFKKWLQFLLNTEDRSAVSASLNLCDFYYLDKETKRILPEELSLKLLVHGSLFRKMEDAQSSQMDDYHWTRIGKAFVNLYPHRSLELAEEIVEHFGEEGTIVEGFHSSTQAVLNEIARLKPKEVWTLVTKYLGPTIDSRAFRICRWLRGGQFFAEEGGALTLIPREDIWNWVDQDVEKRAWYVAHFAPKTTSSDKWKSSLAREVLVRYGNRKDVRNELRANYSTESWWGPESAHHEGKRQILLELKNGETNKAVKQWLDEYVSILDEEIKRARIEEEREGR